MPGMSTASATFDHAWQRAWQRRGADPHGALAAAAALHADAYRIGEQATARVQLLEGSCRWRLSDYPAAVRCLMDALEAFPEHDRAHRAAALQDLGTVLTYLGQHEAAIERLSASLTLRDVLGDEQGRSDVLNNLGIVAYHRGDLDHAEQCYRETAELRTRLGDDDGTAAVRNNLGKLHTDRGELDAAETELRAALELWTRIGNRRGTGMAHNNLGLVHLARGELARAETALRTSLDHKRTSGDLHGAVETQIHLGRIRARRGDVEGATTLLTAAVEAAEQLGASPELAAAFLARSEVEEAFGNHAAALHLFRRYHEQYRRIYDERSAARIHALQVASRLERVERESLTDGLTGLANRRALDRRLLAGYGELDREGHGFGLVLLDLDDFKRVNDRLGHGVGDDVLRTVARLLRDHTRTADLPARYGGEEFAVVLPGADLDTARQAAQQLCDRVRSAVWRDLHPELAVTVSIGVATASEAGDPAGLLALADRRLYRAKHAGKDRVVT